MLFLRKKTDLVPIEKQSRSGRPIRSVSPSIMLFMSIAPMDLERSSSLNCATINGRSYGHLWILRKFPRLRKPVPEMTIGINLQNWRKNIYEKILIRPLFYGRR